MQRSTFFALFATAASSFWFGAAALTAEELARRTTTQWAPCAEWEVRASNVDGNPYDVVATAEFVHAASRERVATPFFYAGDGVWRFRFAGTRTGTWSFVTSSKEPDLRGHTGEVLVTPNPGTMGFVTGLGEKWVRRVGEDRVPVAFVPQYVMYANPAELARDPERIDRDIREFIKGHGFTGFHVPVFCRWFDLDQPRSDGIDSPDPNPDPRTFEVLERLITRTHAAGGVVHFWMWGDEQRRQTPIKWGVNGKADKRLQRYIAARLAPLPGWTMGYGFDLDEWTSEAKLREWHDHLQRFMGWPHLLGARHGDPNHGTDHSMAVSWNRVLDYSSYEHHRPTYDVYVAALKAVPGRPVFSEDRFRIRRSNRYREKDYDTERTRRGLWTSTMAGGVANIWGYLPSDPGIRAAMSTCAPYPNREQIRTYARFFKARFTVDLSRAPSVSTGVALRRPGDRHLIAYQEDTDRIGLDLTGLAGSLPAIAVDTKQPYAEIDLGRLRPEKQTWSAPRRSDWAIAVGDWSGAR